MAGKKNESDWKSKTAVPVKTDFNGVEKEALDKTKNTLETVGEFLLKWDKTKSKPPQMQEKVEKMRNFYSILKGWYDNALSEGNESDREERVARLVNFVTICRSYW